MALLSFLFGKPPDYREAYEGVAKAVEKSGEDIADATDRALSVAKRTRDQNRELLRPVLTATTEAVRRLQRGNREGRWTMPEVELMDIAKFDTDAAPEVGSTFDRMEQWVKRVRQQGLRSVADPAFDFRLRESLRVRERLASRMGTLHSAATGAALEERAQNIASDEYQRAYGRRFELEKTRRMEEEGDHARFVGDWNRDRQRTIDQNAVTARRWDSRRIALQDELAAIREQAGLGGIRDTVDVNRRYGQDVQQTILTGAKAQGDIALAAAGLRAQGDINTQEAKYAHRGRIASFVGQLAGTAIGAAVGGPAAIPAASGGLGSGIGLSDVSKLSPEKLAAGIN